MEFPLQCWNCQKDASIDTSQTLIRGPGENFSPVSTTPAITENPWQGSIAGFVDTREKIYRRWRWHRWTSCRLIICLYLAGKEIRRQKTKAKLKTKPTSIASVPYSILTSIYTHSSPVCVTCFEVFDSTMPFSRYTNIYIHLFSINWHVRWLLL